MGRKKWWCKLPFEFECYYRKVAFFVRSLKQTFLLNCVLIKQLIMHKRLETITIIFIIVIYLPRQFGLLAANCDVFSRRMSISNIWRFYSFMCGVIFAITFPFAILKILSIVHSVSDEKLYIYTFIEITNYIAMYLFSVAVYVRILFSSQKHITYNNVGFTMFDHCKKLSNDNKEREFILPLIIRVIYLYFGYAALSAIKLSENSDNLETVLFFYKCVYFVPDIVMANTMIRVHTTIAMQIICCKWVNQAFSECTDSVSNISIKSPKEKCRVYCHARRRFNQITRCYSRLYEVSRGTEVLTSNLMIFAILKAFAHISSMVFLVYQYCCFFFAIP